MKCLLFAEEVHWDKFQMFVAWHSRLRLLYAVTKDFALCQAHLQVFFRNPLTWKSEITADVVLKTESLRLLCGFEQTQPLYRLNCHEIHINF